MNLRGKNDRRQLRIGVAITTTGRVSALLELLGDLESQRAKPVAIAIVDQSPTEEVVRAMRSWHGKIDVRVKAGARGISLGRNEAAAMLASEVDLIWFPNDTTRVGPEFLQAVGEAWIPGSVIICGVIDERGGLRAKREFVGEIDRVTAWRHVLEPAMLVPADPFFAVGGFEVRIGSGAATPWQSSEGPDLLRRLRGAATVQHLQYPAILKVSMASGLTEEQFRRKARGYGRGVGYVHRKYGDPFTESVRAVVGGLTLWIRKPHEYSLLSSLAATIGRVEGLLGKTFSGSSSVLAVSDLAATDMWHHQASRATQVPQSLEVNAETRRGRRRVTTRNL